MVESVSIFLDPVSFKFWSDLIHLPSGQKVKSSSNNARRKWISSEYWVMLGKSILILQQVSSLYVLMLEHLYICVHSHAHAYRGTLKKTFIWRWIQSHPEPTPISIPTSHHPFLCLCYLWSFENNTCYWVQARLQRCDVAHARAQRRRPVSLTDPQSKHTETSSWQRQLRKTLYGILHLRN